MKWIDVYNIKSITPITVAISICGVLKYLLKSIMLKMNQVKPIRLIIAKISLPVLFFTHL